VACGRGKGGGVDVDDPNSRYDEGIAALGGGGDGSAAGNDGGGTGGGGGGSFALSDMVPSFCRRGHRDVGERGGRGFRGDVAADVGAFLDHDPAAGLRGSEDGTNPLIDPRLGSFG